MAMKAGMFAGVKDARATQDANFFREGRYLKRIDRVKADTTRKGIGYLAIECTVLHVFDDAGGKGHKTGEACCQILTADKDSFLGNVKAFVVGVIGCTPEEVNEESCEALCDDGQPLAGWIAEVQSRMVLARSGNMFCKVSWKGSWEDDAVKSLMTEAEKTQFFPDYESDEGDEIGED